MLLLVAYDIPDDGRRRRVAAALLRLGSRIQYSVFLLHRGTVPEVAQVLGGLIEAEEDNVRIQPLCCVCDDKAVVLGTGRPAELPAGFRVV